MIKTEKKKTEKEIALALKFIRALFSKNHFVYKIFFLSFVLVKYAAINLYFGRVFTLNSFLTRIYFFLGF